MISYFTDGSASPNPGPGGFSVIKNGKPWLIGSETKNSEVPRTRTTNIRMEGLAIMAALTDADGEPCTITTDSEFWINVLAKWAPNWAKNNWTKKGGIKNLDIVKPLYDTWQTAEQQGVKLIWTRGHVGTELNELADEWANEARKRKIVGVKTI
jgi:ribonuclease HI